jgi:flagellar hook-basal body complex protein FliE
MPVYDGESYRIDKIISNKTKPNARAYIDEKNLQIHLKDVSRQDYTHSFSKIINDINSTQINPTQAGTISENLQEKEKLNMTLAAWETSYKEVIELHNQIKAAYQELMKMQ